jgi:anti-sigma B factor antagonist
MSLENVRTENGITIVELHGRLSVGKNLADIESEMQKLIKDGTTKLVVDLRSLDYIDSASLGMLTACRNQLVDKGGQIRLAGAHGTIARIFKVVHMDKIIPCDETIEAAVAALA